MGSMSEKYWNYIHEIERKLKKMKKEICFISVILSDLVKSLCNENSKCGHSIIKENPKISIEIFIIQSHKWCKNFIC